MHHSLNDIGDQILKSIQDSRTPLTDSLLKVVIFLVSATVVLGILERFFERLQKKGDRTESGQSSVRFFFIILYYITLLIALYLTLRSIITELTASESSTLQDMILWLHGDTKTATEYGIKYLVALVIFVVFYSVQNAFFKFLRNHLMARRNINEHFVNVLLNVVKYILLSFLMVASALQIMITGGDSIIALIIYAYICVAIAVPFRQISTRLTDSNKTVEYLITFAGQLFGVIIYVGVIFLLYLGLRTFLGSGGKDISDLLDLPEESISAELKTVFLPNQTLTKSLTSTSKEKIVVHSDDELNIIYYNGKKVGVNTSGRKYEFYGVSVNQPEVTAVKEMTFMYTGRAQEAEKALSGSSSSHFYYNKKNNNCLVLTVNNHSNRVVSITYYSDFERATRSKTLVEE